MAVHLNGRGPAAEVDRSGEDAAAELRTRDGFVPVANAPTGTVGS